MQTAQSRIIATGLLFLFALVSGVWVSRSGKPLSTVKLTIHKLISLLMAVVTGLTISYVIQKSGVGTAGIAAIVVTGLLLVLAVVSGGLLSTAKPMPGVVGIVHKVAPPLSAVCTAVTIYLLAGGM
jgi:hypothetical protein